MSHLLFGHDETVAEWVGQKIGKPFQPPYSAFGIVQSGRLVGGAVFNSHTGDSIEISLAGRPTISKPFWRAVFSYVFDQLKCVRLSIHTSNRKPNKRLRKMANDFGFVFEGIERKKYGISHDAARYAITVDELSEIKRKWRL